MALRQDLVKDLKERGLIHQWTDPALESVLARTPITLYVGFDPTASSLHVGSLFPALMLRRFADAGHSAIAVVGGATGMIGDPSGKSEERKLLDRHSLEANVAGQAEQLKRLIPGVKILNNLDWFQNISYLDFLRDTGKHFTVNHMMAKDSVRTRLEDREQGISYTEFSYMLLQAYDFLHLAREHGVRLQVGGSDQWGNITAGCELARRVGLKSEIYGLTHPLLLKSDGTKFGKSESGNVWIDPARTSAFEFYQFFHKVEDRDVVRFLNQMTLLPREAIQELERETERAPEARTAQKALAQAMTELVHGREAVAQAEASTSALFSGDSNYASMSGAALEQAFAGAPRIRVPRARLAAPGVELVEVLAEAGLFAGKGAARKEIQAGGVYVNGERCQDSSRKLTLSDAVGGERYIILRKGKRTHHVLEIV